MNVEYLIQLLENKLTALNNAKIQATNLGDLELIGKIDTDVLEVENTLSQLRLLVTMNAAVDNTNITLTEVMANGIEVAQNSSIIPDNATACMEEYDISTYAIDPLHEQKIADILQSMGSMTTEAEIDAYILKESIGSPLTGQMVLRAAQAYGVDVRLMMAIMELDSRFGTAGVAVDTLNPGNVGNTGTATKSYDSWEKGVDAVAVWLSRHRQETTNSKAPVGTTNVEVIDTPVLATEEAPIITEESLAAASISENISSSTQESSVASSSIPTQPSGSTADASSSKAINQ
jgi:hypothetical protein